jgi:hypothetical protein
MTLRWEDERYVRLYTRDTPDWQCLSFPAQGLFCLLLRKVDRAGILPLGKHGKKAVSVAIGHGHQWGMLEDPLEELLTDGCVRIDGDHLLIPNFIEAQEATQSDAARKRAQRERARASVTNRDEGGTPPPGSPDMESRGVTGPAGNVTECHAEPDTGHAVTPTVTPNCAVPSRAEPPEPNQPAAVERPAAARKTILGPLGARLVRACSLGLGHGLAPLTNSDEAAELERVVEAHGGPEAAKDFVASTVRSRPSLDPQSVRLLLAMLRDPLPPEAQA